jgi:hypothetical protein
MPVCGTIGNVLAATATGGDVYSWSLTSSDNSWIITGGQGTLNLTYTAGSGGTTGTFTLTVTKAATGSSSSCSIILTNRCQEYCGYSQGFYGNGNGSGCNGMSSSSIVTGLLYTPLELGSGTRKITIGTTEAACLQSKLPSGSTVAVLPNASVSCAGATGNAYLSNGKFKNVLLGNTIALSLNLRLDPSLAGLRITGPYITTFAATSCSNGVAQNGTRLVCAIPPSVITYLGANNTVADLVILANKALGGTYVPTSSTPSLSHINAALSAFIQSFDKCRIFVGFSTTSNGAKFEEVFADEQDVSEADFSVYPNPASGSVTLSYTAKEDSRVAVSVYRADGSLATELMEKEVYAGQNDLFILNTMEWIPGVYFARINTGGQVFTKKLIILRD